jgi:putative ABC transport system substrate-binding protein
MPGQAINVGRKRIVQFALARRWPVIAVQRACANEGALLTYAADRSALYRRAANHVDKILSGAKPGELPIEQATTFELAVNLKTASPLGLTMPPDIMVQATHVIR